MDPVFYVASWTDRETRGRLVDFAQDAVQEEQTDLQLSLGDEGCETLYFDLYHGAPAPRIAPEGLVKDNQISI